MYQRAQKSDCCKYGLRLHFDIGKTDIETTLGVQFLMGILEYKTLFAPSSRNDYPLQISIVNFKCTIPLRIIFVEIDGYAGDQATCKGTALELAFRGHM